MLAAVVIAATNLLPALSARLADEGELLTFPDTEPIQALQAILEKVPRLIVLEQLFAATPRGAALIDRIRTDPQVSRAEVRVMSHTGDYVRQVERPIAAAVATIEPVAAPAPLDWRGTRRAVRHRIRPGLEIQMDGNPTILVDLSTAGAQVVSAAILRPNQRVRVSMRTNDFMMRFRATVAWARFELPKPAEPPRYRAGIEFTDADSAAIALFCTNNKA